MAESIIMLEEMPNIGDILATRFRAAGIETPQELKRYGACLAFEKALLSYPDACVNMLFALEGRDSKHTLASVIVVYKKRTPPIL
ncbi:hypothetical protein HCJ82_06370 [Listeria booriae]|uniref:TfoX/Sxy family DNA transformation protein n=1 Tax=Listeria booriae TaxID=1552123 RepID=UPI00162718CE|nr:TfoX/Sxy family DNA transformation protein [Listeria booriae]MBC2179764.1 hypothetical protein [Listeria booriae]